MDLSPESVAEAAAPGEDHEETDGKALKSAAMKEFLKAVGYALGIRHDIEDHASELCANCFEAVQRHFDDDDEE